MTDSEFNEFWYPDFVAAFPSVTAWLGRQPNKGLATITKWRAVLRRTELPDALTATEKLLEDGIGQWDKFDSVPSMIRQRANAAATARKVVERGASMVATSKGAKCNQCGDSGIVFIWTDYDIQTCRKLGHLPKARMHHPAGVACSAPGCENGARRHRVEDKKKGVRGVPKFDGRFHCLYETVSPDNCGIDEQNKQLEAWCHTVQEWQPVESYDDVTERRE